MTMINNGVAPGAHTKHMFKKHFAPKFENHPIKPHALILIDFSHPLAKRGLMQLCDSVLRNNTTLTASKVISWRSVTHMRFLAFSHQY